MTENVLLELLLNDEIFMSINMSCGFGLILLDYQLLDDILIQKSQTLPEPCSCLIMVQNFACITICKFHPIVKTILLHEASLNKCYINKRRLCVLFISIAIMSFTSSSLSMVKRSPCSMVMKIVIFSLLAERLPNFRAKFFKLLSTGYRFRWTQHIPPWNNRRAFTVNRHSIKFNKMSIK